VNLQPEKFSNPEFLSPLYQLALDQFHQSAQALNLTDNLIARMKSPDRSPAGIRKINSEVHPLHFSRDRPRHRCACTRCRSQSTNHVVDNGYLQHLLSNSTAEGKEVLMKKKLRSQVKDRRTHPEKEDCPRGADCHGNDSTRHRQSWRRYRCNTRVLENKFLSQVLYLQA